LFEDTHPQQEVSGNSRSHTDLFDNSPGLGSCADGPLLPGRIENFEFAVSFLVRTFQNFGYPPISISSLSVYVIKLIYFLVKEALNGK
jgi:hypothetical protein